jgi:hypothetical protein
MFGTLSSGFLIIGLGSKAVFAFITLTSIAVAYAAYKKWLQEGKTIYKHNETHDNNREKASFSDEINQKHFKTEKAINCSEDIGIDTYDSSSSTDYLNEESGSEKDKSDSSDEEKTKLSSLDTLAVNERSSFSEDKTIYLRERPYYQTSNFIISKEIYYSKPEIVKLALKVAIFVLTAAIIVIATPNLYVRIAVMLAVTFGIVIVVYYALQNQYPVLAKATLFLFLREVLQPNIDQVCFYSPRENR